MQITAPPIINKIAQPTQPNTRRRIHNQNIEDKIRQSNELFTTTAQIGNRVIHLLLDEGSQVNTITPSLVAELQLPVKTLSKEYKLQFANSETSTVAQYVHCIPLVMYGIYGSNPKLPLYFSTGALVMDSPHDILIGIPFLRYWNIISHFCNNTKVYLAKSGHQITIPLNCSQLTQPCFSTHCIFHNTPAISTILPNIHPFIPPMKIEPSSPPKSNFVRIHSITIKPHTSAVENPETLAVYTPQTLAVYTPQPLAVHTPHNVTIHTPQLLDVPHPIPQTPNTDINDNTFYCNSVNFIRHTHNNIDNVYLLCFKYDHYFKCNTTSQVIDESILQFQTTLKNDMLQQYPNVFPETLPRDLPPADRLEHAIDLTPEYKIPPRKLYRQSDRELTETRRQITDYLDAGHIRPSTSSFGAPVLLVRKKDGSMRMCIDYRALNDITLKNTFPLPRIDDLHDRLQNAYYFTKLDLYSGYHQIPVKQTDQYKTAFTSRYGTYEFIVMPFGLTNAPSTFQTAMNSLFFDWLDDFVIVYLDDILIYSRTRELHLHHVKLVLERLAQHQWYCKLKKCEFAQTSVEYLGHIISQGKIEIDPRKMETVRDWPTPFKNLTEVQSFLGLIGYYRKFIKHFSHKAKPLHEFSHKDTPFVWTAKHTEAVTQLKNAILSPECLAIFDPYKTTFLSTDACDYALGAVLSQKYDNGERPIAFISKILTNTEYNYSMWEKELYAVIWSIKYFRPYLLHLPFHIRSDNKPSIQLLSNCKLKLSTSASNRVMRWIITLQAHQYKAIHIPGTTNIVADAISRFPHIAQPCPDDQECALYCQTQILSKPVSMFYKRFHEVYQTNEYTKTAYDILREGQYHPRYQLQNDLIVTRETPYRIYLPDDIPLRKEVFTEIHDAPLAGHPGFHKLIAYVHRHFVGPRLRPDVLDFVRSCPQCQIAKPRHSKQYGEIMPLQPPEEPWQDVSMDLITQLPPSNNYTAIFVIVDRFSKMAHFIPTLHTTDATQLAILFFDHIVRVHTLPRSIISDRDTRFLSNFWTTLFALCDTTLRFSAANHPQTDGQTERTNRTLEQYLRLYVTNKPNEWTQVLSIAEIAYNTSTHSSIGMTPFYLVFQRHPNLPLDLAIGDLHSRNAAVESMMQERQALMMKAREQLAHAYEKMIITNADKKLPAPFQVEDLVLVHRAAFRKTYGIPDLKKFDDRWYGPFPIVKVINANAYKLEFPDSFRNHPVINVTFLQPYRKSQRFPREHPDLFHLPPVEADDDENDEYEAEAILDFRLTKRNHKATSKTAKMKQLDVSTDPNDYEFLIKWKGYKPYESTWEPYEYLSGAHDIFETFRKAWKLPNSWEIMTQ